MIIDKLLAFADGKAITTTADSDVIEIGKSGDEVARTLNLVCQLDDCGSVTPTTATITPKLKVSDNGTTYADAMTFPSVSVADCIAGKRVINFAKLPLGALKAYMKLSLTVANGPLVGAKYSAWLTPSAEAEL